MLKPLSPEAIQEAFDGDFEEVAFAHYPTEEEINLIKLNLVARAAEIERTKQIVAFIETNSYPLYNEGELGKNPPCGIGLENVYWQALKGE